WVDLFGASIRIKRLRKMPGAPLNRGGVEADVTVVGKRFCREREFAQRCIVIAFDIIMVKAQRQMALAEIGLKSQRFHRFGVRFLLPHLGWLVEVINEAGCYREPRTSKSKVRVQFDRLIVKIDR